MTITTLDVEVFLGRDLTQAESVRAAQLIPYAKALLESRFPGLALDQVEDAEIVLHPQADDLWTPRFPVVAVSTVEVDGNAATGFQWDEWGRIWSDASLVNEFELNLTFRRATEVAITYDYGADPVSPVLVQAVASMVATTIRFSAANPDGVQSEALGSYNVSYGDFAVRQQAIGMTVPDLPGLDYWDRRKRITSVALR